MNSQNKRIFYQKNGKFPESSRVDCSKPNVSNTSKDNGYVKDTDDTVTIEDAKKLIIEQLPFGWKEPHISFLESVLKKLHDSSYEDGYADSMAHCYGHFD